MTLFNVPKLLNAAQAMKPQLLLAQHIDAICRPETSHSMTVTMRVSSTLSE